MSLWQFAACIDGYRRANETGEESPDPMTPAEFDQMLDRHRDFMTMH